MSSRPFSVRFLLLGLMSLLLLLQARLWLSDEGWSEVIRLRHSGSEQGAENAKLTDRNGRLEAEVGDLKQGVVALEERARADLGMIGEDESFYLLATEPEPSVNPE